MTPDFDNIWPLIYPQFLDLKKEMEGESVDFLDMTIWCDKDPLRWKSKLYDKRIELIKKGLKLNKFPHPESRLTKQCKYGVITSQLARFSVTNTETKDFYKSAVSLYLDYYNKGYETITMNQYFYKFLKRNRQTVHLKPTAVQQRFQFLMKSQSVKDAKVLKARQRFDTTQIAPIHDSIGDDISCLSTLLNQMHISSQQNLTNSLATQCTIR